MKDVRKMDWCFGLSIILMATISYGFQMFAPNKTWWGIENATPIVALSFAFIFVGIWIIMRFASDEEGVK